MVHAAPDTNVCPRICGHANTVVLSKVAALIQCVFLPISLHRARFSYLRDMVPFRAVHRIAQSMRYIFGRIRLSFRHLVTAFQPHLSISPKNAPRCRHFSHQPTPSGWLSRVVDIICPTLAQIEAPNKQNCFLFTAEGYPSTGVKAVHVSFHLRRSCLWVRSRHSSV